MLTFQQFINERISPVDIQQKLDQLNADPAIAVKEYLDQLFPDSTVDVSIFPYVEGVKGRAQFSFSCGIQKQHQLRKDYWDAWSR